MSYFNVTILGCGAATPSLRHMPSSQLICYRQHAALVDCGEGTQLQLRRFGASFAKIDHIYLSHLHGDHFLGLPGLLSTMSLHQVEGSVTVHTFAEGAAVLTNLLDLVCRERTFDLKFDIIDPATPAEVYNDGHLRVRTVPLRHRVPCVGYVFEEINKLRHIKRDMVDFYGVPNYLLSQLKEGADLVLPDGRVIDNAVLTDAPTPPASYAYCSDTAFFEGLAESVRGVDTIYHETTYGDADAYKAGPRGHSTARQAGRLARLAGARRLVMGHYSKVITDESILAAEAAEEFDGIVIAGTEGLKLDLA
ncbi:MAG: ribonuclease Z [Muribaculaceae bacterium]|nr:ribonuclease Z [Muribaculaceae bacterium]